MVPIVCALLLLLARSLQLLLPLLLLLLLARSLQPLRLRSQVALALSAHNLLQGDDVMACDARK